jgi:hypothetical protein
MAKVLADILNAYRQRNRYYDSYCGSHRALEELVSREGANCMCERVASDFTGYVCQYAREHELNIDADTWYNVPPRNLGYTEREWLLHTVSRVYLEDDVYIVDWTAAQYGESSFPVVKKLAA